MRRPPLNAPDADTEALVFGARCRRLRGEAAYHQTVRNEFTAILEQDEGWFIAYSPEVPGANGQGRTKDEALKSLAAAIELILEDRREDGLRGVPPTAIRETVTVG